MLPVLVSREFLFRVERDPAADARDAYRVSDLELASRLSFFLWSSIPDDELLDVASPRRLSRPDVLEHEARRMLADPQSASLIGNFVARGCTCATSNRSRPTGGCSPDFDDNLHPGVPARTELLFTDVVRDDRSVLDLLRPTAPGSTSGSRSTTASPTCTAPSSAA